VPVTTFPVIASSTGGATAVTTAGTTWQYWNLTTANSTTASTVLYLPAWQNWNTAWQETREQQAAREVREVAARAERERQEAVIRAAAAEQEAVRQRAAARAQELLLSLLTEAQAADYLDRGWFEVRGSAGGRYRIRRRGQAGNVDRMPDTGEEREASLCAHPPGHLPDADAHLAQMMALVTDEPGFLRTANVRYCRAELPAAA